MKKILLSLALFAGTVFGTVAQRTETELTITPVWVNDVANGVANPLPDIDCGWGKPTADNPGDKTVGRFAVGKDGKILLNNHKENAIMAWDGKAWSTYAKLPAVTVTDWNGNENDPNSKWNGTAITTDDAGNVIYNYCFINADKSLQYWGVVAADGTITDVDLSTPLTEFSHGRLDIIGHIVGDVNSEKGGIGYATTQNSDNVIMFHFKGDGKKVTSLTAKAFEVTGLASNGAFVPSPKYLTVDELMANGTPEKEFYAPYGGLSTATLTEGTLASGDETLKGFGNRQYNSSAVFSLHGNKYIVRSYVSPTNPNVSKLTAGKMVMTYGIFDLATGQCIASWQDSEYSNAYGYGTITAEAVDNDTVNIYMFVCTGNADASTGTTPGAYGGMFTVTAKDVPARGTKDRPYEIATAADLCNAWTLTVPGEKVYFVQTADIDMAGVKDWHAFVGYNNAGYNSQLEYDGQNHIIKNFAPVERNAELFATDSYSTSIFGVLNGTVKNLGVVNVDITATQGEGVIAAYGGHSTGTPAVIENVFVTGTVKGSGYTGALLGTTGNTTTIKNSYVNVTLDGGAYAAALVGRLRNELTLENVYAAGTVSSTSGALLVSSDKPEWNLTVKATNVVAFNTGVDKAFNNVVVTGEATMANTAETKAAGIAEVQGWSAFSSERGMKGYPALEAFAKGTKDKPYEIATAEDLCKAWTLVEPYEVTYFVQTADIDMAGVSKYTAVNGGGSDYTSAIVYDGGNHIIKNFAPTAETPDASQQNYYNVSIFGVMSGHLKNLGVVDAKIVVKDVDSYLGAGIIGGYAGHGSAPEPYKTTTIENVFVTGSVSGGIAGYTGGLFGTNGSAVVVKNCYANVVVEANTKVAAICGRVRNDLTIENTYAAGTVKGDSKTALIASSDNGSGSITVKDVVAFNTGSDDAVGGCTVTGTVTMANTAATQAAGIAEVQKWTAFSATMYDGAYPSLASFKYGVTLVNNVKETVKLAKDEKLRVGYALTVGYANATNAFAVDAAGDFIQLFDKNGGLKLKKGDVIPAGWEGSYATFNGAPEIVVTTLPAVTAGTFTPREVAAGNVTSALVNNVIVVKNVSFAENTPETKTSFTGKVGDVELTFYNQFTVPSVSAGLYDVTGIVALYQGKVQLYIDSYATAAALGDGTPQNPFVIASAADLCNAYQKVAANPTGMTYFVQTADIDLAGVKNWHAINGFNGVYTAAINYDGQNHLIKNFAPEVVAPDAAANNYYMGTIFGVLTGTVKDLGIVDAKVVNNQQGGGFLAAYAGHDQAKLIAPFTYIENVFVTGSYDATDNEKYIGGLVGTTGSSVEINNCYVNADIKGKDNVAGFVGRLSNDLAITHCYVAGSVAGTGEHVALAISSKDTPEVIVDGIYAFNTGAAKAVVGAVLDEDVKVVDATDEKALAAAIAKVQAWKAYSKTDYVFGLPGLNGFGYSAELPEPVVAASIAETIALESGTEFDVNYELTVAFVNYKNVFARDFNGDFIQLYGENTLKVGDVIPAGWHGTYELYKGVTPEITNFVLPENITEGTFEPAEVAAEDVTVELVNSVVLIKGVVLAEATPAEKANFTGKVGDVELSFRNNYGLESVTAGTYDITVVVTIYNDAPSLYVVNFEEDKTTGIEGIAAEGADAVYYNLQGVEVANPESGIYIVRRGNKVTKEVIRK